MNWEDGSPIRAAAARELSTDFLFIGGAPGGIFVECCHRIGERRSVCAEILLIDNILRRDDKGHDARRPILRRVSDDGKSAGRLAIRRMSRQHFEVVTVE